MIKDKSGIDGVCFTMATCPHVDERHGDIGHEQRQSYIEVENFVWILQDAWNGYQWYKDQIYDYQWLRRGP